MLSEKTVRKNAAIEISAVFKMEADLTQKRGRGRPRGRFGSSLANAPPSVRVQAATITNQLDRLLTHAHPSLAFKNIEAAASGYDQQQQNPANPPAGQKQGGAVEQKEESAIFDPRSIGARQARDGHWYVPDQSRLGKYLTPTPRMRRWRWPGSLRCFRRCSSEFNPTWMVKSFGSTAS